MDQKDLRHLPAKIFLRIFFEIVENRIHVVEIGLLRPGFELFVFFLDSLGQHVVEDVIAVIERYRSDDVIAIL